MISLSLLIAVGLIASAILSGRALYIVFNFLRVKPIYRDRFVVGFAFVYNIVFVILIMYLNT